MTRRAFNRPNHWTQNLLMALAMGSAAVLLGCGGGGGGNNNPPPPAGDCGSPAGSGTVVCGFVTNNTTNGGVNGATVRIRNISGATIASGVTQNDVQSGSAGFYKISVGGALPSTTLISVDVPSTGFVPGFLQFIGKTYDASRTAPVTGGPCDPAVTLTPNADTRLTNQLIIFSDSGAPPPPVFVCPRS